MLGRFFCPACYGFTDAMAWLVYLFCVRRSVFPAHHLVRIIVPLNWPTVLTTKNTQVGSFTRITQSKIWSLPWLRWWRSLSMPLVYPAGCLGTADPFITQSIKPEWYFRHTRCQRFSPASSMGLAARGRDGFQMLRFDRTERRPAKSRFL